MTHCLRFYLSTNVLIFATVYDFFLSKMNEKSYIPEYIFLSNTCHSSYYKEATTILHASIEILDLKGMNSKAYSRIQRVRPKFPYLELAGVFVRDVNNCIWQHPLNNKRDRWVTRWYHWFYICYLTRCADKKIFKNPFDK